MKKLLRMALALVMAISATVVSAQRPTEILDKAAASLSVSSGVKIDFTLTADGSSVSGYIKMRDKKFVVNAGGIITWFDGKTMWTYVKQNEEVNVTTPSAAEVQRMNPHSFLSLYKKGYTAKMGKSSSRQHEVVLTGGKGAAYERVTIRVDKSTGKPAYIHAQSAKGNATEIHCKSIATNQKYSASTFTFSKSKFPNAEVIDLR